MFPKHMPTQGFCSISQKQTPKAFLNPEPAGIGSRLLLCAGLRRHFEGLGFKVLGLRLLRFRVFGFMVLGFRV